MDASEWISIISPMLILPIIIIPISLLMIKFRRGYNTLGRAARTREAQAFAARMLGGMLLRFGLIMLLLTLAGGGIGFAFLENETVQMTIFWIILGVSLVLIIIPIILTERAIRRHFDKDGRPYKM
jgi:magnesium-transporting ATPase (P-type)